MSEEIKAIVEPLEFIEGTSIKIGRKDYIIPPYPYTRLVKEGFFKLQKKAEELSKENDIEKINECNLEVLEFIYRAILMNYPDASREETIDMIPMGKIGKLTSALIDSPEGLEISKNS